MKGQRTVYHNTVRYGTIPNNNNQNAVQVRTRNRVHKRQKVREKTPYYHYILLRGLTLGVAKHPEP